MRGRSPITLLAGLLLALLLPGAAGAAVGLAGDSSTVRGYVGLTVYASANIVSAEVGEVIDGRYTGLTQVGLEDTTVRLPDGPLQMARDQRVARWDCARRDREFMVIGRDRSGRAETATFAVRTPSCRTRLLIKLPTRVRPGRRVTAIIRDSFEIGGVDMRFCSRAPQRRARCRTLSMPDGVAAISTRFRAPRRGRHRIHLGTATQRVRRVVSAGLKPRRRDLAHLPNVVTTGDSMMQSVDQVLADRLDGEINLFSDVRIASGLTKPFIVDWTRLPVRQVRDYEPQVAILFLGANEDGPLRAPGRAEHACCGRAWRAEYARRARRLMRTYIGADGRGGVIWLLNPVPGDTQRVRSMAAVNAAVRDAAAGVDRVRLVDLGALLTPGGVYRGDRDGVPVRQDDGIHLSLAGARIAVKPIIAAMRDLGVLD